MRVNNLLKGFRWVERHKIDNPPTSDRYQIPLSLAYLRGTSPYFLDSLPAIDEEPLPLWIEHAAGIDYTTNTPFTCPKIWTPIPAGQKYIDIYRGNPRITTDRSRGDLVFDFFDDFLGTALDTTKWTLSSGTSYSISGSEININGGGTTTKIFSKALFGLGYAFRTRTQATSSQQICAFGFIGEASAYYRTLFLSSWLNDGVMYICVEDGTTNKLATSNYTGYRIYECDKIVSPASASFYTNGSLISTLQSHTYTGNQYVTLYCYGSSNAILNTDWVLVRKYTATEPTHQLIDTPKTNPLWRGW